MGIMLYYSEGETLCSDFSLLQKSDVMSVCRCLKKKEKFLQMTKKLVDQLSSIVINAYDLDHRIYLVAEPIDYLLLDIRTCCDRMSV